MSARVGSWRTLRSPGGGVSLRVDARTAIVVVVLAVALVGIGAYSLTTGEFQISVLEVLETLVGQGSPATKFIVTTLRLPRLLVGLLVGAGLAVSGAVLQSVTRNPLGSPDFVGFSHGSATGAIIAIVVFRGSIIEIAAGALAGGLITAVVIYLLAFRRGVQGYRLILIGIGVSAMLLATNNYLVTRASLTDALAAQTWMTGSLNSRGWDQVIAVGLAVAVLVPVAVRFSRRLALLEMGDDTARALGIPVESTRLVLIGVSVGLAAIATAAAGPIAFVALTAPQLARMLTRAAGPGVLASAVMGALLLVGSDLLVQKVFAPAVLPVGIATGGIGGLYLAWLLAREWRKGRA